MCRRKCKVVHKEWHIVMGILTTASDEAVEMRCTKCRRDWYGSVQ